MTLLWVTDHFVMGRLIETMKIMFLCGNFALKSLQIGEIMSNNEMFPEYPVWIIWINNQLLDFSKETHP